MVQSDKDIRISKHFSAVESCVIQNDHHRTPPLDIIQKSKPVLQIRTTLLGPLERAKLTLSLDQRQWPNRIGLPPLTWSR
jgi:hypothetical protein